MVTTVTNYNDARNRAASGTGYDGVVRVVQNGHYGSGVLLYDGRAVLTAAHLFASGSSGVSVRFETAAGVQTLVASSVSVMPGHDAVNNDNDLALVWLTGTLPTSASRYELYRASDEIGKVFSFAGYGTPGTGVSGSDSDYGGSLLRLKAGNQFDADAAHLKSWLGASMGWAPTMGTQLVADFDNGLAAQDALARLGGRTDLGLGVDEGLISPGDSGGPAFIDGRVAGIASYTASLALGGIHPDIDGSSNSSYGEIGFWQRVSQQQQWIDQSLRAHYTNAPTRPEEVQRSVAEGQSGTVQAYFLLQFTGVRSDPNQWLSVDYTTRDGSAVAGADYIAASGRLVLYPDENQAVIPVEILGDIVAESDETFYLDVTNPVGGSFGAGVVKLTAVRTILNDDLL